MRNHFTTFSTFNVTYNLYNAIEKQTETFNGGKFKINNLKQTGRLTDCEEKPIKTLKSQLLSGLTEVISTL